MNEQQKKLTEDEINTQIEFLSSAKCNHTYHKYIDITGDLIEGTLLSRILYWFTPDKKNNTKVRIFKDGEYWIAKQRKDWWEEIRISERQYDKAIKRLAEKGFITLAKYKFNSMPTVHIRPEWKKINEAVAIWKENLRKEITGENNRELQKQENGNDTKCNSQGNNTKCNSGVAQTGIPITCITNNDYNNNNYDSMEYAFFPEEKKVSPTSESGKLSPTIIKAIDEAMTEEGESSDSSYKEELKDIAEYFVGKYARTQGKPHKPLTRPAISNIVYNYLHQDEDEYGIMDDVWTLDQYIPLIDMYMQTNYREGIEKSLSHFMSGYIRRNLKAKLIE